MMRRVIILVVFTLIISITVWIYFSYSTEYNTSETMVNFDFGVKNVSNSQRDRLFKYLDKNFDQKLSKDELKTLFRQLFYSTKLNKSYVNQNFEEKLFDALRLNSEDIQLSESEFNGLWDNWIKVILSPRSALIVVDVQNDFIDDINGSMPVPNGKQIVPVINKLIQTVDFDVIVYTYDWHPYNHCSFVENARNSSIDRKIIKMSVKSISDLKRGNTVVYEKYPNITQKLWPRHCVQNTSGAEFYKDLLIANGPLKIAKGTDPDIDSYSAFNDNGGLHSTPLDHMLQQRGITDVYLTGVLYEFCVSRTAIDALSLGYRTGFIEDSIQTADMVARNQMKLKLIDLNGILIHSDIVSDMVSGKDRTVQMGLVLAHKLYRKH